MRQAKRFPKSGFEQPGIGAILAMARLGALVYSGNECVFFRSVVAMLIQRLVFPLCIPLLASCGVLQAIDAEMEAQRQAQEAAWLQAAKASCEQYGFKAGTEGLSQCIQTEVTNSRNRKAAADEAEATREEVREEARRTRNAIEDAKKKK
jgi:hypothetical protein